MKIETSSTQEAAQRALINEAQSAHFYAQDGQPRYTVEIKSGPRKGESRAVGLREARKENLYPSITHIHKLISSPALNFYRESHLLAAARRVGPLEGETDEDYFGRVIIEANKDRDEAAAGGTGLHANVENILQGKEWDKECKKAQAAAEWINENVAAVEWVEKSLVNHSLKIGGKCDALVRMKQTSEFFAELGGMPVILDFKTRRFKQSTKGYWKCAFYRKDCRQLAFYASCLEGGARVANLAFNTKADSLPAFHIWPEDEQAAALKATAALMALWMDENKYHPERLAA